MDPAGAERYRTLCPLVPAEHRPSHGRPLALFFTGSALLPSSSAQSSAARMVPITQKPAGAVTKVNTGTMHSISMRLGCEYLTPALPVMLQLCGGRAERAFFDGLYTCTHGSPACGEPHPETLWGWGLYAPEERPPPICRTQSVLGSWLCST